VSAGPWWREAGREAAGYYLVEGDGVGESAETEVAEIAEAYAVGCRLARGEPGVGGDEDLPALGNSAHPCRGMNGQTDVGSAAERRVAAVDAGADTYRQIVGPGSFAERSLDRDGRL
jgi:hypothetical protein